MGCVPTRPVVIQAFTGPSVVGMSGSMVILVALVAAEWLLGGE